MRAQHHAEADAVRGSNMARHSVIQHKSTVYKQTPHLTADLTKALITIVPFHPLILCFLEGVEGEGGSFSASERILDERVQIILQSCDDYFIA